ncbi:MAG TPA: DUF4249 domain-containing protein, partial [Puia sp.]
KRFLKRYFIFFFFVFFITCVRRINPPIRQSAQILVVEGLITTDTLPYAVKLSYTGSFTNASVAVDSNQNFINDATVIIKDDAGDSTYCNLVSPGMYQSVNSSFIGTVGSAYTLVIHLSNGKTYISTSEKINPVPPIDSITVSYDSTFITDVRPTQFIISANTRDPASQTNYYRWTASAYIPRKSWGEPCDPYTDPPCTNPYMCVCYAECDQYVENTQINVLSDQLTNGNEIIQPVFYSPIYWFGDHYVEVRQYSLNQDSYIFWQQYIQQTTRTGSILDPLPSSLIGNIHNAADSTDNALGYFEASAVNSKKIVIEPFFLQQYYLESVAGQYIPMGDCHLSIPNSLADDMSPVGWENAQVIQLH